MTTATETPAVLASTHLPERFFTAEDLANWAKWGELETLEQIPYKAAWHACIDTLFEIGAYADHASVPWLERVIPELLAKKDSDRYPTEDIGQRLLDWYLFRTRPQRSPQALAFAIEMTRRLLLRTNDFQKKIARKIKDDELYWKIGNVEWFVKDSFNGILIGKHFEEHYGEDAWNRAERALQLIMQAEDITMLPLLRLVLSEHGSGRTGLHHLSFGYRFRREQNLATLRTAIAMLQKAKEVQQPLLDEVVGDKLRPLAELVGCFWLRPHFQLLNERTKGVEVSIGLACSEPDDYRRLQDFIERGKFSIRFEADRAQVNSQKWDFEEPMMYKKTFFPTSDATSRVTLSFYIMDQRVGEYMFYV